MVAFLERNGVELTATNAEAASVMLAVAAGELAEGELAEWIDGHACASSGRVGAVWAAVGLIAWTPVGRTGRSLGRSVAPFGRSEPRGQCSTLGSFFAWSIQPGASSPTVAGGRCQMDRLFIFFSSEHDPV
jgi:hypothetical protein